jgi:hypothetical protein
VLDINQRISREIPAELRLASIHSSVASERATERRKDMNGSAFALSRFSVRQGYKGWMVYDRQLKGPALIGTDLAVDLTKEQAYTSNRC